ncbi:MAG: gamma-glutamyl-gamma-aminobutyrate hydrolase family protein [Lachnospiraceae bacterium]
MNPVIGVVVCGCDAGRQFVSHSYIQAMEDAGAVCVIIPCTEDASHFPRYYGLCDGFLFCGGDDISPRLFGEDLLTDRGRTDMRMDCFHLDFMKYVLSASLPILAVCRGMQVLNIALGGTIYQDISLRNGVSQNHMQRSENRGDVCHRVACAKGSMLYNICGSFLETNSFHHQCIKTVGKGLTVSAVAADGIVEAIEDSSRSFLVGLQWHPECMYESSPPMRELFAKFIDRAAHAKNISVPIQFP